MVLILGKTLRLAAFVTGPAALVAALAVVGVSSAQEELDGDQPVAVEAPMADEAAAADEIEMVEDPAAAVEAEVAEEAGAADAASEQPAMLEETQEIAIEEPATELPMEEAVPAPVETAMPDEQDLPQVPEYEIPVAAKPAPLPSHTPTPAPRATAPAVNAPAVAPVRLSARMPIDVTFDRAKVLRLSEPAGTVIIGNPAIVDVTLQDTSTLVLTAKGFGSTNMIILNADGVPIADEVVQTLRASHTIARVYKGTQQFSYSCTPECTSTVAVGDNQDYFDTVKTQMESRRAWASQR